MQLHGLLRNQAEKTEMNMGSSFGLDAMISAVAEAAEVQDIALDRGDPPGARQGCSGKL